MAAKSKERKDKPRQEKTIRNYSCYFCDSKKKPSYKEFDGVQKFVSERARIYSRSRSGVCAKHQKQLAIAVKRLRHLGLLPFKAAI